MSVKNAMTVDFLSSAYGGESMAHMRYTIWGDSAEKDGYPNIVENLQGAIDGELHEIDQMYPVYLETAKFQNESDAQRSFHYALEAEKIHAKMFKDAQDMAKQQKDISDETIYVCPICGFTEIGDNVENCPVCGAKKDIFKSF